MSWKITVSGHYAAENDVFCPLDVNMNKPLPTGAHPKGNHTLQSHDRTL